MIQDSIVTQGKFIRTQIFAQQMDIALLDRKHLYRVTQEPMVVQQLKNRQLQIAQVAQPAIIA